MFLPVSKSELNQRNIDKLDFILISGDAYVDHPSFGHALISRLTEALGFSVGIIPQPLNDEDFCMLGSPRHAFLVASGVVDSMVNNYTAAKKPRRTDEYSEGGVAGKRPDRAATFYCKTLKKLFPDIPVIAGGIEVSLRRLSHYDYWTDSVMPSILLDSEADLIVYGMGERPMMDLAVFAEKNIPLAKVKDIRGTAYLTSYDNARKEIKKAIDGESDKFLVLPSYQETIENKTRFLKAFMIASENVGFKDGKGLIQLQSNGLYAVVNPPQKPLTQQEMDFVYGLDYERSPHPMYTAGVPAINEVEFSVQSHRGCFGNCSFCALNYHQGRVIQSRSCDSIIKEAELLTDKPNFKGYIHDLSGPSANFRNPSCDKAKTEGVCKKKNCIGFKACKNLHVDHKDYLKILQAIRKLPKVKKVFVRSGVRFDYLMMDSDPQFFNELIKYHVSGQLKVAPEHISNNTLELMNKPPKEVYERFYQKFYETTKRQGLEQYLVPYFISSHPGCTLNDAIELALYLKKINYMPKQVQDFYPTPSTLSTVMFFTEINPSTNSHIFVAKSDEDKAMQRALLQYRLKSNKHLIKKALIKANRLDLFKVFDV